MFFNKKYALSVHEMIELEKRLRASVLYSPDMMTTDEELSDKLHFKIEYVDKMDDDNEAELLPIESDKYWGLIRLRKESQNNRFAYMHEVMHYIFDVGYGNKVTKKFTRKKREKTANREEQKINYTAAAYIMPYEDILTELNAYDVSRPKMDEIKFVRNLRSKYNQSETATLRRIREVRKISKAGGFDFSEHG